MANGDLGSLWFNLGIKDTTGVTLNRILKAVHDAEGSVSKLRLSYQALFDSIKKQDEKDAFAKNWEPGIKNAMKYFEMLMRIDNEQKRLSELKGISKGINTSGLVEAERMLKTIKGDLMDLQLKKFGGVDEANLANYENALRNVVKNVRNIEDAFKKDNSLSVAANNAERLKIKLEQVKNTLADIYNKQSSGMKGGFDTRSLLSAGNSLRGVQRRIATMLSDDKLLMNESKFKSLISDIAYAMEKARGKVAEYNRERSKTIAQNKELSERKETQRKLDNGEVAYYAKIRDILLQIDALNKSISTPVMNASRLGMALPQSIGEDLRKLYSIKQTLETNMVAGRNMGLGWLKDFLNRNGFSEITKELKKFTGNIDEARNKYQRLFDILNRLRVERSRANVLGLDTQKLDNDIAHVLDKLHVLRGIVQTGIGNVGDITGIDNRTLRNIEGNIQSQKRTNNEKERSNELERKHQEELNKTGRQIQSSLVRGFKDANNAAGRLNSTIQDLKSLFMQGGLVFGAQQFAMSIIRTGGEMEKQHIAMQSILGDMQNANTMFNQTKELALQSPFTFSELNRDVKQLAAYGVEYEDLYDTTKRLADMASGLGVSFERIALAFGQVQARGWLDGKELRQIAYAGIPLLDRLSKYYSQREGKKVTTSDVKGRITNREVSFQDVKNIFWEMTDAGGQFYNMQLTLSETLLGRYNKLKDAWEIMLSDFARGDSIIGGTFKTILDSLTYIVQQMHTLGPVMAAAFTGFAIKRGITAMGGTKGNSFLASKASIASDIQAKVLQGQELSAIEQRILATKNRITNEDLKALSASRVLTLQDLNRLRISGQITAEQYKQYRNIVQQQIGHRTLNMQMMRLLVTMRGLSFKNGWSNFATSGMAAMRIVGGGIKALGATLWSAIGGLPGLIITGLSMGIMSAVSKYQDLSQKIKQTQDEIFDRRKQVAEFTRDNNANKAIASGDEKEMEKQIDAYKEKLKELAPYDYANLVMKADEKKSHEERLKYLSEELRLLNEANKINAGRLSDRDTYSSLQDRISKLNDIASEYYTKQAKANAFGATDSDKKAFENAKINLESRVGWLKSAIQNTFGDISKDENLRRQAVQAMNSIFSALGVSSENANLIRASILQAFGIYDDGWLSEEVGKRMSDLISERFPEIALKIKSDQSLNEGERKKVEQLMKDAKNELINQYPVFSTTLQNLLDQSKFTAVISLVTQGWGGMFNDTQMELAGRVPNDSNLFSLYSSKVDTWGKENSWTAARNKANEEIKKAEEEYKNAKKSKASNTEAKLNEFNNLKEVAKVLLNFDYDAENKKKDTGGNKEDNALKDLRERIDAFKAFRQMYQKAKEVMPKSEAKNWAYGLFPEMKDLNPEDYIGSIEKLKRGFNFELTSERKKTLTSLNREIGDWKISEILKPEFEKAAANFKEALDRQMKQWDLYRTLLDKTGNENFANLAFTNGGIFDEQTNNLIRQFETDYNIKFPGIYADEGDAKKSFEGIAGAYERWKAIADLVKNNYVKYLQEAADIIEKTATIEEKILAINERYDRLAREAASQGNVEVATRYRLQQRKEVSSARLEGFERSSEYTNFFGAILSLTVEQAKTAAEKIRQVTNEAFQQGAIDAREYAKRIKQINEQMKKLQQPRKSFFNGGLQGIVQQRYDDGESIFNEASNKYGEWQEKFNEALVNNDIAAMEAADQQMAAAEKNAAAGEGMMSSASDMMMTIAIIDTIVHNIDGIIQGLNEAFGYVKEAADAMGVDTESDGWQDAQAWFSSASSVSSGATKAWEGLKNGNVGGIISGVAQSITGPFTAFAKAHDAKMDRRIQQAERNIRAIDNMSNNISAILEKILGGLYSYTNNADTVKMLKDMMKNNEKGSEAYNAAQKALGSGNYFDTQYAALLSQKSEIQKQRDAEDNKKKTDQDAIAQYDQQIKELDLQIKTYAQDFLKEMYSIDFKSWASQLTDSIVEAWSKGEDAATAYHDKVQELIKDLTKNILSQKIMEMALQPTLEELQKILEQKGKLDETDIPKIADKLIKAGDNAVEGITNILDALKEKGWDLSENGTLSVSNSIKSITEDTADILAAYLNSVRLDCSVNRENLRLILVAVQSVPELNNIARSQLTQLTTLVTLAEARNSKLDDMYSWMNKVTNGVLKISMK